MKVFWVDCEETPVTETTPSPKGQPAPSESESESPNASESGQPIGGTTGETPGPTGEVLAAGGGAGANVTPPPTDTDPTAQPQASTGGWPLVLLIIATLIALASLVTPVAPARRRS
jgi:hypothetical protein